MAEERELLPLLQKYWGSNAQFRDIRVYENPDWSRNVLNQSQQVLIDEVIDQAEAAMKRQAFSDVFISMPDGSGKTLLFQIPALYLAEKYNTVTVVVTPFTQMMNEQVRYLNEERGIKSVGRINMSMTMTERYDVIKKVEDGTISLLYISPELLVTMKFNSFLGKRKIGLLVLDQAQTIYAWGKDFRSDYWFMGEVLRSVRKQGLVFPVLCVASSIVYSGSDDRVMNTISELGLEHVLIHIGCIRRDNISFDISFIREQLNRNDREQSKYDSVLRQANYYVESGERCVVFFPYRAQVMTAYNKLLPQYKGATRFYHGQLQKTARQLTEKEFRDGLVKTILATSAFGPGKDIDNIRHVIHFAPSGNLMEYYSEISLLARDPKLKGIAHAEHYVEDAIYSKTLYESSEIKQWQLQEMMKKLCNLHDLNNRTKQLIFSDTFAYLFGDADVDVCVRQGLLILAKDLENKYGYTVLGVKPRVVQSKSYVIVPYEMEVNWLSKYSKYAVLQKVNPVRVLSNRVSSKDAALIVRNTGNIYLVDMESIWMELYPSMGYSAFRDMFFGENFKVQGESYHIAPRVRVEIRYNFSFERVSELLMSSIRAIRDTFGAFRKISAKGGAKYFTAEQFRDKFFSALPSGAAIRKSDLANKIDVLLDVFTRAVDENAAFSSTNNAVRVLQKKYDKTVGDCTYTVASPDYNRLLNTFSQMLARCQPNTGSEVFHNFYAVKRDKRIEILPMLKMLELLNIATYEVRGGDRAEVQVYIKDPNRLHVCITGKYTNNFLKAIEEYHSRESIILQKFFENDFEDEQRWDLIENYFLGNNEYVMSCLGIIEGISDN